MKVKELIEELQKCNPDAKVEVDSQGGDTIAEVKKGNPASSTTPVILWCE